MYQEAVSVILIKMLPMLQLEKSGIYVRCGAVFSVSCVCFLPRSIQRRRKKKLLQVPQGAFFMATLGNIIESFLFSD